MKYEPRWLSLDVFGGKETKVTGRLEIQGDFTPK